MYNLLARRVFRRDHLRKEAPNLGQFRQQLQLVHQRGRRLGMNQRTNPLCNRIQRIDLQRQLHAPLGAELVHQHLRAGKPRDVLEQQRRPACLCGALAQLGRAVGDLRHLQTRAHHLRYPLQFACLVQLLDPVA